MRRANKSEKEKKFYTQQRLDAEKNPSGAIYKKLQAKGIEPATPRLSMTDSAKKPANMAGKMGAKKAFASAARRKKAKKA